MRSFALATTLRFLLRVLCIASISVQASCMAIPPPDRLSGGIPQTVGEKVVVEKREPNLLLAADGTECVVSRSRFEEVEAGDRVSCQWRELQQEQVETQLGMNGANRGGRRPSLR